MYKLKDYPDDFKSNKPQWLKFKKKMKKISHTQLRRGKMTKYEFHGWEIEW